MQCKYLRWIMMLIVVNVFTITSYAQAPNNVHKVIRFADAGKQICSLTITGDETKEELVSQMPKTIKAIIDYGRKF